MVILTQGQPVGRVVIPRLGKRNEMRCINESEFVLRQPDPEAASDALIVVEFNDPAAKGDVAPRQLVLRRALRNRCVGVDQIYPRLHEVRRQL